jgi:glycosyltransferase involved in cell wall biosynthesis
MTDIQVAEARQRDRVQSATKVAGQAVSIVVPVMNETHSLIQTVDVVMAENAGSVAEIALAISPRTTGESRAVVADLIERHPDLIWAHTQSLPHLGGALREVFRLTSGAYTLLMASDLETDPALVKVLVSTARESGADIVTASRWMRGGRFHGYHPVKLGFNWLFQRLMSLLYLTRLSDMTYGYRIFRSDLLREFSWEELKHPFLLETMLKPLRLGRRIVEIPVDWRPRPEGESQIRLATYWGYIRIALKVRFRRIDRMKHGT